MSLASDTDIAIGASDVTLYHDDLRVIPRTCFSIEPGIHLPEFGIRSEENVYVGEGFGQVTGEEQEELVKI